jgi:predicted Zn-dependent protease
VKIAVYTIIFALIFIIIVQQNSDVRAEIYVPDAVQVKKSRRAYKKPRKNPMINWVYKPKYGDYYDLIDKEFKKYRLTPSENHFRVFPIRYHFHPANSQWKKFIISAIDDYAQYFPMEEILNPDDATLHIYVLSRDAFKKKYPTMSPKTLGCGHGRFYGYTYHGRLTIVDDSFNTPYIKDIILHEIGHAFGIKGHSDSKKDLMYKYEMQDETGLTPRDLNTLFLLYEQWDD